MLTLKVDGMTCEHCKKTITDAIHTVDAEAGVQIDLEQGIVNVQSRAASNAIKSAITNSGFEVITTTGTTVVH